jgi:hypothetical protein
MTFSKAIALTICAGAFTFSASAAAQQSTKIDRAANTESYASIGDTLVRVSIRESLPNAFGGADVFGRKRDKGFVEIRYMGMTPDGRAIFRRRSVDVYSNETTMNRSGIRYGSATIQPDGRGARISGFSSGPARATVEPLPADTVEFAFNLTKTRTLTVEDHAIEIIEADESGVTYVVRRRK